LNLTRAGRFRQPWMQDRVVRRLAARQVSGMQWTRLSIRLAMRALRHPATGAALLRVAWRFRRRGWYRRPPFLPLPAVDYVRWRMYTAYGDEDITPPVEDVERYARWAVREP